MREAIGGGFLFNLVIVIVSIVILFFVSILSYSKAYRVKNRIVEIIEENNGCNNDVCHEKIAVDLSNMGYSTATNKACPSGYYTKKNYNYCVSYEQSADNGYYYKVITYVHFDFPIIGDFINIPIKGETKILGKVYND